MHNKSLAVGALCLLTACTPASDRNVTDSAETPPAPPAEALDSMGEAELGILPTAADDRALAFPGAAGFGRFSEGGRAGQVYHVTNLNDSGPGSLRAGVEATGPRTIVFEIAGTIALESPLVITSDYITIAGQTAPGEGITLRDNTLRVNANHVIIRYIRSRIGGESGVEDDAISVVGGSDIILDHVSTSWAIDEVLSSSQSWRNRPGQKHLTNLTVQWSIIAEGLYRAGHEKGDRAYGSLIRGNGGARYSWHHNLWATHHSRMPRIGNYAPPADDPVGALFDFRNNVFYNWGHGAETDFWDWVPASAEFDPSTQLGLNQDPLYGRQGTDYHYAAGTDLDPASVANYNFINNAYIQGPETPGPVIFYMRNTTGRAYFSGNTMDGETRAQRPMLRSAAHDLSWVDAPFDAPGLPTHHASDAADLVLRFAGASRDRDSVDERIINDVHNRTGGVISSEQEVGGWPVLATGPVPEDADRDGMADGWELSRGLSPSDGMDGALDPDGDGYTHLEDYLNSLARPR